MTQFKPGDRVLCVADAEIMPKFAGRRGTIIKLSSNPQDVMTVLIDWDKHLRMPRRSLWFSCSLLSHLSIVDKIVELAEDQ